MDKIDVSLLKNLKMTGADLVSIEPKETGGRKTRKYNPWERQATPEDVLSWKDGDKVVIVLKNGKKYSVEKNAAAKGADENSAKGAKK